MTEFRLMMGDCLGLMTSIDSESVDLAIIDPPYTMTKTGNSCRPNYMPGGEIISGGVPEMRDWSRETFRVLKSDSHAYVFTNKNDIVKTITVMQDAGFSLHNVISMIKDTKMPNRWYLKYTEFIMFFRKGRAFPINDMTSRDYIFAKMPTLSSGKIHPTQKPIDVIETLVRNSSSLGGVVIDPFMGSGTTGVACKSLGRSFIGIEKNEGYFLKAKERIEDA